MYTKPFRPQNAWTVIKYSKLYSYRFSGLGDRNGCPGKGSLFFLSLFARWNFTNYPNYYIFAGIPSREVYLTCAFSCVFSMIMQSLWRGNLSVFPTQSNEWTGDIPVSIPLNPSPLSYFTNSPSPIPTLALSIANVTMFEFNREVQKKSLASTWLPANRASLSRMLSKTV